MARDAAWIAKYDAAAAPLLADLRAAGLPTDGFGDFRSTKYAAMFGASAFDHERSVPILLAWLPRVAHPSVKDAIARHLATRYAKPFAARALIEEYRRSPRNGPEPRYALALAIAATADESVRAELLELTCDASHGSSRTPIIERLGKAKKGPDAVAALLSQIGDEDVTRVVVGALRSQLGPEAARPHVEALTRHRSENVRAVAVDALRRLDARKSKNRGGAR